MNRPRIIRSRFGACALLSFFLACCCGPFAPAAETPDGGEIYRQRCAVCHGEKGEGARQGYEEPLIGDRPLEELAKIIAETMPEDDPESCTGKEAEQVAAYIYDAFYSPAAQQRNGKPQAIFQRLTVRQYENAVADLIAGFSEPGRWGDERGLRGEYFSDRRFRRGRAKFERIDPVINFDFDESTPDPEKIDDPKEFAIRWEGSILAPQTGDYEFVLQAENGVQLWVNDRETPLIDASVRSGVDPVYRETIRLLGGRAYPIRLEFFKSEKAKEKTASVSLKWKTPRQAEQLIPARYLSPERFPETLVINTPFPPDDRSYGYERGIAVSKQWDQATTYAAVETAGYVAAHLNELADTRDGATDRAPKARAFLHQFAHRAFRRPLTDEQQQFFVDRHFDAPQTADNDSESNEETNDGEQDEAALRAAETAHINMAAKKSVLMILKSPRFLYHDLPGDSGFDQFNTASRLSFALWDSLPDDELLAAAASGELATREQVAAQAERMLDDLRTRSKMREFLHQWLKVEEFRDLSKDNEQFPQFDEQVVSDLRVSLDLFLDDVVWNESADYRQLLLADFLYLNGRLAPLYGAELAADAPFQKVNFDPSQRAGVLSHPLLMSGFAYHSTSSPIHRGVFIARNLLGRTLRPPPDAVVPLPPEEHADLTTRERIALQTKPAACASCHSMINPLGFSLEHYDAIGRYRTEETGKPIDASGFYQTLSGAKAEFGGVRDLADFLATSEETQAAFVEQLFEHLTKQPVRAFGLDRPAQLRHSFAEKAFNIRQLLVNLVTTAALEPGKDT